MKKTLILLLSLMLVGNSVLAASETSSKAPFGYSLADDINRAPGETPVKKEKKKEPAKEETNKKSSDSDPISASGENAWEKAESYYPNAKMSSAISKYKSGNYTGCLQELISLTKKDPYNPLVLYYLGMTYTQIGNKQQAINAYNAVINMHSNSTLTSYATKGIDCLLNNPACHEDENVIKIEDDLDKFVNSPYGNGLSDELNQQMKELELRNIQKRIKSKDVLEDNDIDNIQKFDKHKSNNDINNEKLAMADTREVSNEDVLSAIETLKKAGVTVSINPYQSQMPMNDEYAQLSMMLGNNNYNNNNSMMNMLPMLMSQNKGQVDPQVIQAMMMNSMLPDFTFNDNKKDY